jgi:nucleoside-diphosphate-sugar epimerase
MLEDNEALQSAVAEASPDIIVHLAAQAGVRYSLENPRAYIDANIVGTFNLMEAARAIPVQHLLMASTSSVYGANTEMPFAEAQKADTPLTIYAATKKANEAMGHSYAHIYSLPTTMFRFFAVYGPWGRPDMALFKFTKGILEGTPIDIYNNGEMWRDFTYVTDLVRGIRLLIDAVPGGPETARGPAFAKGLPSSCAGIANITMFDCSGSDGATQYREIAGPLVAADKDRHRLWHRNHCHLMVRRTDDRLRHQPLSLANIDFDLRSDSRNEGQKFVSSIMSWTKTIPPGACAPRRTNPAAPPILPVSQIPLPAGAPA